MEYINIQGTTEVAFCGKFFLSFQFYTYCLYVENRAREEVLVITGSAILSQI